MYALILLYTNIIKIKIKNLYFFKRCYMVIPWNQENAKLAYYNFGQIISAVRDYDPSIDSD